jgi:uncharacterized OsmC-like protein
MVLKVEGDIDTDALLGKTKEKRAGFSDIRISIEIDSPMTKKEKEEFIEEVDRRCPISENTLNPTKISIKVA